MTFEIRSKRPSLICSVTPKLMWTSPFRCYLMMFLGLFACFFYIPYLSSHTWIANHNLLFLAILGLPFSLTIISSLFWVFLCMSCCVGNCFWVCNRNLELFSILCSGDFWYLCFKHRDLIPKFIYKYTWIALGLKAYCGWDVPYLDILRTSFYWLESLTCSSHGF